MSKRSRDILAIMREKSSMSQKIVAQKDDTYALYAGGNPDLGFKMATLDVFMTSGLIPKKLIKFLKLYRSLLDQKRKAWLATTSSEITMLGFLLGMKREKIKAVIPRS